ncbi:MAG: hypothetical protein HY859_04645 [Caulobacterales bacterium]|nr:hypothetical protein [Caulobacterales bacterium]
MLLTSSLKPFAPTDRVASIDAEVEIEGRSWIGVRFRLAGVVDQIQVPAAVPEIVDAQSRAQAEFAAAVLERHRGGTSGPLNIGPPPEIGRADDLWRTTCFEVFARLPDGRYVEFNISPSGQWAAYQFESYRAGRTNLDAGVRLHSFSAREDRLELKAILNWNDWPFVVAFGLSAVIEFKAGNISYWALRHPSGRPDFHYSDNFALAVRPGESR